MPHILITGGTGLIGSKLTQMLTDNGHQVSILSRKTGMHRGVNMVQWDPTSGKLDPAVFNGVDHVVHLAGAGIADKRWTPAYKQELYDSRIVSTRLLVSTILRNNIKLKSFVSTSAIGLYGNHTTGPVGEEGALGNTFLARLCRDWEAELEPLAWPEIRKVVVRVGVVLARESGFIPEVARPVKWGVGAPLGSGNQLMSWIHINDLCSIYYQAIFNPEMQGAYNAVAPEPTTNKHVTKLIARKLHRYIVLPPVPEFALSILFGEISGTLVANQHIWPQKLIQQGFAYQFPCIDEALDDLL